ncbi:MAG TPA: universal stress protein [Candidatus Dormibacteraeota bacterium]|nr:universal stress protein [Candidatus Dormibacteraeota bacterium]
MDLRPAACQRARREHGAGPRGGRLTSERPRGRLKVYLGATPGSGKTYAMLREAHELVAAGHELVVAYVETYARPRTVELVQGLEVVPRAKVSYRGATLEDMDLDAVLARRPEIALVDELAHTNAPGLRNEKRWQDAETLRDAGIDVISTVNVQHLESVKDLVEKVSGIPVRETLPDRVLDGADVIQFIDIAPEALRKRMRHGNIYAPEKVDVALANFFRPRNLAAMRQIGLRLVADSMARSRQVVGSPEDVLVAVSGSPASEELMRRGIRLARRRGGSCVVVTVQPDPEPVRQEIERFRRLTEQLGGGFTVLGGRDVAGAIVQAARDVGAEHVVVGEETTGGRSSRVRPTIADRIIDGLPDSDVHVIARVGRLPPSPRVQQAAGDGRPDPMALLRQVATEGRRRAMLRVYLGYAPGIGTTTAMLGEARRRAGRGTDVVVAAYRVHDDPRTALAGLDVLGGLRDAPPERLLDVDAVLARNPDVVCVDDLTGLDVGGRPRLEAVPRLLRAGITVLATLHLLSVRSAAESVARLLGRPLDRPVVGDELLDAIDEFELVDLPPDEVLRRIRDHAVLTPAQLARAMQRELRPQVLAMLRENLLRISADQVDRQFVRELRETDAGAAAEVRGRIVLCLPVRPALEERIRAAARYARAQDATFTVVTVRPPGLTEAEKALLGAYATLTHQLQGEFVRLETRAVAPALARFIEESMATEVIMGHRRRRWRPWDTTAELIRLLQGVDIHVLRGGDA